MRAAVVDGPGQVEVRSVPDPVPGPGEVLVRVGACGLCGTDVHIADGTFPPAPYPLVPGHEFAGEVVALGPGRPADLSVGDRVGIDPSLYCGHCDPCRTGRANLCARWGALGDTVAGGFAEYVAVPAGNAHRLPDGVDLRAGALAEPLACAVHGMRRLPLELGESVLIVGAGTMGLLLLQLVRRRGAGRVDVVDRNAGRLPVATALGATATATSVAELDGRDYAVAIDVTGAAPAIEAAFTAVRRGGRLLVFGVAHEDATISLSPYRIYNQEITVLGSMGVLDSYAPALDLIARGRVETAPLLTHALPLDRFGEALDLLRTGQGIKIQVLPGG